MKYIIESNDVIGYTPKYAMLFGDGYMIQPLEDLEVLNSDYINEHYGDLQDTAYQKGFEDGKAVHDKGCEGCKYANVAGTHEPCVRCSNSYGNQWTAKDDKIEVGDEVEWDNDFTGDRFIVTRIYQPYGKKEQCDGIDDDGDVYRAVLIESLVKTGRHFDIASILEDMRNDWKQCLINDCTGYVAPAPCCLDCDDRDICPDRCPKIETTYCIGVIDDGERISATVQTHTARD